MLLYNAEWGHYSVFVSVNTGYNSFFQQKWLVRSLSKPTKHRLKVDMDGPPPTLTWKSPVIKGTFTVDSHHRRLWPARLNHYALATLDMDVTHKFWTEVMGCQFRGAVRHTDTADGMNGQHTGNFLHCFYSFEDGSSIAFFELAHDYTPRSDGIPHFAKHIALPVSSRGDPAGLA